MRMPPIRRLSRWTHLSAGLWRCPSGIGTSGPRFWGRKASGWIRKAWKAWWWLSLGRLPCVRGFGDSLSPGRSWRRRYTREADRKVVDVRDRIGVAWHALVEAAVVSAWPRSPVFLGQHVEARALGRIRSLTDACGAHHLKVLPGDPEFFGCQSSWWCLDGQAVSTDEAFDSVVRRTGC